MSSAELESIYHYLAISERVGTSGQPTAEQFASIAAAGYQVIMNLRTPDPDGLAGEAELVAALGMEYVYIPVVWKSPKPEDLAEFFEAMDACRDKKVWVHCAANARVSCFILLYRVIREGVPLDLARETMLRIWQPNTTWRRFVDRSLASYGV
jgi:protein tyrosine phosphatase (PTP) superfamily phosphohydrolase (DUF442 family)